MHKLVCIVCPNGCNLTIDKKGEEYDIKGAKCKKGNEFALEEMVAPKRSISSTIKTIYSELPVVPVRTSGDILKKDIFTVMKEINKFTVEKAYDVGEVIIKNVANTGVNIICTVRMGRYIQDN